MNSRILPLSRRYQSALRRHVARPRPAGLVSAHGLGNDLVAAGLPLLELARLHEKTLLTDILPVLPARQHARAVRHASRFFAASILPPAPAAGIDRQAAETLEGFIAALSQRTVQLANSNLELKREIIHRKQVEAALKKSERHYSRLLLQSDRLQEQLRRLSRQILCAQEDERKRISRELHDVIAQSLTTINVRLATLKKEASLDSRGLDRNITRTQQLVEQSVDVIHRFARELRPAVLDDLGLVPALHSYLKAFTSRTGVRTHLTAFTGIEALDTSRRTVLFRVAQEALTNIERHARASRVEVVLRHVDGGISMTIADNGCSFKVDRAFRAAASKRLGLLGMRERLDMVGGRFAVESAAGRGTTVHARVPFPAGTTPARPRPVPATKRRARPVTQLP